MDKEPIMIDGVDVRNTSNYLMNLIKEFQIVLKFTIVLS